MPNFVAQGASGEAIVLLSRHQCSNVQGDYICEGKRRREGNVGCKLDTSHAAVLSFLGPYHGTVQKETRGYGRGLRAGPVVMVMVMVIFSAQSGPTNLPTRVASAPCRLSCGDAAVPQTVEGLTRPPMRWGGGDAAPSGSLASPEAGWPMRMCMKVWACAL